MVIGQPDFTHDGSNHGGLNGRGLASPGDAVLDPQGNLYVADNFNHRVLVYDAPLSTHDAASVVLGQSEDFSSTPNIRRHNASRPNDALSLALGGVGNLQLAGV